MRVPKGKPLQFTINFLFPEVSELKRQIAFVLALVFCVFPLASCESRETQRESSSDVTYELNEDLLSRIGMTREDFHKKYGLNEGAFRFVDEKCVEYTNFTPEIIFSNYSKNDTAEEMAERYGLTLLTSKGPKDFWFLKGKVLIRINNNYENDSPDTPSPKIMVDVNYYNNYNLGFDTQEIYSRYHVVYGAVIGAPEDATMEDLLSDPLIKKMGHEICKKENGRNVTTGKLNFGDIVWIDGRNYRVIPYVEELKTSKESSEQSPPLFKMITYAA